MKKSLIMLVASLFVFLPLTIVNAEEVDPTTTPTTTEVESEGKETPINDSKWAALQPGHLTTSEGIQVDYKYDKTEVLVGNTYYYLLNTTFTIPEDYNEETLVIDPGIFDVIGSFQQKDTIPYAVPGDHYMIKVTIINNSKYIYNYDENSFVVYPSDDAKTFKFLGKDIPNNELSDKNVLFNDGAVTDLTAIPRPYNTALAALVSKTDALDDAKIIAALKAKGYPETIESLDDYYVDFYNTKYNKDYKKLEDFSDNVISEILCSKSVNVAETNTVINALHFNYFYNELVSVGTGDTVLNDSNSTENSVGEYMRDDSKGDENIQEAFGTLDPNSTNTGDFSIYINGPKTTNSWAGYISITNSHMTFTAKKGIVEAYYVDEKGKTLSDMVSTSGMVSNDYQTNSKEIFGYELLKVEGDETGKYIDGTIKVVYVYQYVLGEGDSEPEEPVVTPVVNKIPYTGIEEENNTTNYTVLLISLDLIIAGIFVYKRLFN